jgi:hypothetical protein
MSDDALDLKKSKNIIHSWGGNLYSFSPSKKPIFANFSDLRFYVQPAEFPKDKEGYVSLIWDAFQTSRIFINSKYFESEVSTANDVLPYVYVSATTVSAVSNSNYKQLMDHSLPHGQTVHITLPGDNFIIFSRYIDDKYDGWMCAISNCFNSVFIDQTDADADLDSQQQIKAAKAVDAKDVDQLLKKLTKKIKNQTSIINEAEKMINDIFNLDASANSMKGQNTNQLQFNFADGMTQQQYIDSIKNRENNNMTSYPVCTYLSVKTQSIDITSKSYSYANKPNNFASCSHPTMTKSQGLTSCPYGIGFDHNQCPHYKPITQTICTYTSADVIDGFSFSVVKRLDITGLNIVDIYNSRNNQLSYFFGVPSNVTDEELFTEIDSIINEIVNSWPKDVVDTVKYHRPSEVEEAKEKKKSFIMSLV